MLGSCPEAIGPAAPDGRRDGVDRSHGLNRGHGDVRSLGPAQFGLTRLQEWIVRLRPIAPTSPVSKAGDRRLPYVPFPDQQLRSSLERGAWSMRL